MQTDGFDWDEGNWPKCGKHGLTQSEIEEVFSSKPAVLPDRTPVTSETRFNAVGRTRAGRVAFVVFTLRKIADAMLIRPISARYMHKKEVETYDQEKGT